MLSAQCLVLSAKKLLAVALCAVGFAAQAAQDPITYLDWDEVNHKLTNATAANLTGTTEIDLDAAQGVTNGVTFVWDAKADCPTDFNAADTKVKVTVKRITSQPAK